MTDKYEYGAESVCIKCEQALSFYPADGKVRKSQGAICSECSDKIKKLLVEMGKPQCWTEKVA